MGANPTIKVTITLHQKWGKNSGKSYRELKLCSARISLRIKRISALLSSVLASLAS